jgi:hypothetical protein
VLIPVNSCKVFNEFSIQVARTGHTKSGFTRTAVQKYHDVNIFTSSSASWCLGARAFPLLSQDAHVDQVDIGTVVPYVRS